jgi:TolB-like protein/DNA-binding winged helix-turn-helix (wHTH) protein
MLAEVESTPWTVEVVMPPSPQRGAQIPSTASEIGVDGRPAVAFYDFDAFRIDVRRHQLLRHGEVVAIKPKALETLLVLVEHHGRLVSKDALMSWLWPDTAVEEANLTQNVFVARKALGEAPGEQRFIATVARQGYRFVADVAEVLETEAPATMPTRAAIDDRGPRSWRGVAAIAAGLVGLLLSALVLWNRAPASDTIAPIRAMAVLPFRNLSSDAEQAYFVDGMTDAVIADLASVSALRVASHQSVRRYAASALPLADIARQLRVDAIVEGSVSRAGRRIRLTVQVIDARTDQHLWAATYDRELDDVLTLQAEVAGAVAGAVRAIVSEPERAALAARRTVDPEAYDAYLRGRYFFAQRSEVALRRSIEHYRRAIDRDPSFAPAHAGLALAYVPMGFFGFIPAAEGSRHLRAAAERARQLDPTLVDADVALAAATVVYDWDWPAAERAYGRILERRPDHAQARLWYGFMLGQIGRLDKALVEREQALAAEPLSLQFNTSVADTLMLLGRNDEAIARYRRTLELAHDFAGAHQGLGLALLRSGKNDEAVRELEAAVRTSDDLRSTAALGYAYGRVGRTAEARGILEQLARRMPDRYLSPIYPAFVHAGLGDRDAAFDRLDAAFLDRSPLLIGAKVDPLLDPLRDDPRFTDLLKRMNLPVR